MKISLSPEVERLIAERVSSGRYGSADEVVREGLELLQEREAGAGRSPANQGGGLAATFESIASGVPDTDWENVPVICPRISTTTFTGARRHPDGAGVC